MAKTTKGKFDNVIQSVTVQSKSNEDIIKETLVILPELQNHIPPLSKEELTQLEINLVADGCRDALLVWLDENDKNKRHILVDGHNRYEICTRRKIDYHVKAIKFDDMEAVKDWMINNQLGKRNVTDEIKSYLRGKQYNREKDKNNFKGNQHTEKEGEEQNLKLKTHERLAEEHKVSAKTIQRDEKYVIGLDTLVKENHALKWKILQREIPLSKNFVESIPEKSPEEIAHILQTLITKPKATKVENELIDNQKKEPITPQNSWEKWETAFFQVFKKLKKNYNQEELAKLKAIIAQIEGEMQ